RRCRSRVSILTEGGDFMTYGKTNSQLRVELRQVETEVQNLRKQEAQYAAINKRLEDTLENLTIHQEELRVQNEQLRHMQDELEQSHHKYFDLFEGAPIGYFSLNRRGIILEVNLTGAEMLGYERKHLTQTQMSLLIKSDHQKAFSDHLQSLFSEGVPSSVELEFLRHHDGKRLFVILESIPLYGNSKRVTECRTAMIDMTKRKQLEEQLHHAQKLESLGVLAGGIAHDFNNLLAAISTHARLGIRGLPTGNPAITHFERIENAALNGGELANKMLAYSGRETLARQPVNLTELIESLDHLLYLGIPEKAEMTLNLDAKLPRIQGDPSQLRQIVLNLISNASESLSNTSGTITLTTGTMVVDRAYLSHCRFAADVSVGGVVYVEVTDSGAGINSETMENIFDPFFTTKFTGRGLGLAAVLGIMRTHGGAIDVSSEVGSGTSFRILFPIAEDQDVLPAPEASSVLDQEWRGSGLFLVVDDDEEICDTTAMFLEQLGFNVLTAKDGYDALRLFQKHAADLSCVLLDLTMPGINGEQVFKEIRRTSSDVPVILSSGYTEEDVVARFKEQPIDGFIQKPYPLHTLLEKVQEVVGP
ncbi:MAG: response regulator, partial [Nitrospirales bacterium]